jgi:hypothetical protein
MSEYNRFQDRPRSTEADAAVAAKVAAMLKQYRRPAEPKREVLRLTKREREMNKKL